MAYENPQFDRLKQTIETKQQEETSRFGSKIADLLQANNKVTEQTLITNKAVTSQMSQYFQATIKLQTESNSILKQIAEILTKNSSVKGNHSLIGSAAKQGINFDISREQPKKGIISNMWQATANANIQKEIRKSNRKLAKSLGLSMTLTTAMTTPASSKFRGIVAESEMDFNVVNTNILLGMYELQRLSLQQLVDINKQTGAGIGKGTSVTSITKQQIKAEKMQTEDFKDDFNQNADPRKMMQKIGGIPLIGGYLQMITAPIKELLTLPSLPLRLRKGWNEFKDRQGLAGSPTAALKRTGLYKSDQDRAYSFLGGDFIKIIENIRADAAAIRYQVTGEKPGTDPRTGKRLDQSRAELYDAIKGEFFAAKRNKYGQITATAEQTKAAIEEKRQKILEEDIRSNMTMTGEILQGLLGSKIGKAIISEKSREKLGIQTTEEQAKSAVGATRVAELAKVENAELRYRIEMNDKLDDAIRRSDEFSFSLGGATAAVGGLIAAASGAAPAIAAAAAAFSGAASIYSARKSIKEESFIDEFLHAQKEYGIESKDREKRKSAYQEVIGQRKFNEAGPGKGSLAGVMGGWGEKSSLFPDDIKNLITQFTADIHIIADFFSGIKAKAESSVVHIDSVSRGIALDDDTIRRLTYENEKHDTGGTIPTGKRGLVSEKYRHEYIKGKGLTQFPTLVSGPASVTGSKVTEDALQTTAVATSNLLKIFQDKQKDDKDITVSEQIAKEKDSMFQKKRDNLQIAIANSLAQIQKDQEDQTDFLKDTEKKKAKPKEKGFFESIFGGLSFLKGLGTMLLPLIPTILGSIFSVGMGGIIGPIMAGVTSFLTKYIAGGALGLAWNAATGLAGTALGGAAGLAGKALGGAAGLGKKALGGAAGLGKKALGGLFSRGGTIVEESLPSAITPTDVIPKNISGMKSADLMKRLSTTSGTGAADIEGAVAGQGAVIGKATSGMLSKVAIPLIIATGLAQMFKDTSESGSLVEGIFGNMKEGGWADAFKGMSKYAAMGATAGLIFGGIGAVPGAIIGAALGGIIGYFGTDKLSKVMDNAGDMVSRMNIAISDFFTNYSGETAGSWAAEFASSKVPIVMPLLAGILGSTIDGISWLWRKAEGARNEAGDMIDYANLKIIDFFSTKYGKEGASAFSSVPVIGPIAGGVLGSIVDVFADVFRGDFSFPSLDIVDTQIVGVFKAIGSIAGNISQYGMDHGFPIGGPLVGGLFGTAVQAISWIIGEKATADIRKGLTWDNANKFVTDIFYKIGPFAGDMAKFSSTNGVPIIGPLIGGLFGTAIDIIRGIFSSPETEAQLKIFGARVSEAWTSLMLDFKEAYNSMINAIKGGWSATKKFFGFKDEPITNAGLLEVNADREKLKQKAENTDKLVAELDSIRQKEFDDMMAKRAKEKEENERLYEKYDTPAGTPNGPPKTEEEKKEEKLIISDKVKGVADLVKTTSSTVKDVSTGLVKTSLKVSEELQSNSAEFKDHALEGINWLGNSIFTAFKTMGAMFLGIVQKLSGWFKDNAPDYYEKNIKPVLEGAGNALKTGGEFTLDFTKNTALPALGTAAGAVKDFAVNTAIPAIKSGAQTVGSSVATGASIAGNTISGVAANVGNLTSDIATRARKWVAKGWSNKYDQRSRDAIIKAAANQKVPEDYLFGMAMIESQGDPNAHTPSGTYKGLFQFGPEAWKTYGSGDPYDPDANALAGAKYMRANITALQKAKIPITLGNVYLAHQQGLGGTLSLHRLARTGGEPSGQLRKHMDTNSGKGLNASSFLNMWGYITENLKQKAYKLKNAFKGKGGDYSPSDFSPSPISSDLSQSPSSGGFLSNAADVISSGVKSISHNIATGAGIVGSSIATGAGIASNKILSAAQSMKGMGEKVQPEKMVNFLNKYSGTTFNEIDKTPWCARYVSATLECQGIKSTRSAAAASYLKYGQSIWDKSKGSAGLANARPGDIAIFSRKGGNHVAFVESVDPSSGQLRVIGGNQSDHVTEATRSIKDLLAIRRPDEVGGSSDYTPMAQSPDQGTSEGIPATSGENGKGGDTNLVQSALGTIGKFAKMAKGGAGAIYDELNLNKFGFKRPEDTKDKISTKTTYTPDASNQSPVTPEEGNQGGLIQNALNYVTDLARKAEAIGNVNRAKQGRAPVQSLVKALGLEQYGFKDLGGGFSPAGTKPGMSDQEWEKFKSDNTDRWSKTLGRKVDFTDVKDQYQKDMARKGANQATIKQASFDYEQPKQVWDEQIPQSQTSVGKHSNQAPITISPTQRGPSTRQSSNVEHRTTVEEINPSRMDPEVDELVWKLFTTVPDIFKKDANLFGTGIMF